MYKEQDAPAALFSQCGNLDSTINGVTSVVFLCDSLKRLISLLLLCYGRFPKG